METSTLLSLFVGFGGVLLGGLITYFTERQFRKADQKDKIRINFQSAIIEVGDALSGLVSTYKSFTSILPVEQPDLISLQIRRMADLSVTPSTIENEKLFSVSHKEDQLFSPVSLFLKRYNATFSTLRAANKFKTEVSARWIKDGVSTPTMSQDIAHVGISLDDTRTKTEIVTLENLYRDILKKMEKDIAEGYSLVKRLNENSDRKFSKIAKSERPRLELTEKFEPIPYIADLPFFELSQLPIENP